MEKTQVAPWAAHSAVRTAESLAADSVALMVASMAVHLVERLAASRVHWRAAHLVVYWAAPKAAQRAVRTDTRLAVTMVLRKAVCWVETKAERSAERTAFLMARC